MTEKVETHSKFEPGSGEEPDTEEQQAVNEQKGE
jgi:hypothetical protein